jgi:tRNA(Ile)-lysidine synthase
MDVVQAQRRVADHIEAHGLMAPGAQVAALVSGGPDSSCLHHVLGALGYDISAIHVNHKLRGADADIDAEHCARELGATVLECPVDNPTEARLRDARYEASAAAVGAVLRATGHTASDQVETVLQRLVSSGTTRGIPVHRSDSVVRPILCLWREETVSYCKEVGLGVRVDSTNPATKRGILRETIIPLLRELHPAAEQNILRTLEPSERLPRSVERGIGELLRSPAGSRRIDLGSGVTAVREYERIWLESSPVRLEQSLEWSGWRLEPRREGLVVRGWRPGDRLGADGEKLQDLFVKARVPASEREAWPLIAHRGHIVVVPGIACAPGYEDAVVAARK